MPISSFLAPSAIAKPGVCTSSTRPASPYEGQVIYETDTDKILAWTGSAWYAPWNTAWGVVAATSGGTSSRAYKVISTGQTINATVTADITDSSITWDAVSGRLYKLSISAYVSSTSASGLASVYLTNSSNTADTSYMVNITNTAGASFVTVHYLLTASGSTTRKWRLKSETGNTTIFGTTTPGVVMLEDIGPA